MIAFIQCEFVTMFVLLILLSSFMLEKASAHETNDGMTNDFEALKVYYFPYTFNSGVGNREEIALEGLLKESTFSFEFGNVSKWNSLKIGHTQYLAASEKQTLYLLTVKVKYLSLPNLNTLYFNSITQEFPYDINAITILEHYDNAIHQKVPLFLIATSADNQQVIKWYQIKNNLLEELFSWEYPGYGTISEIKWLKEDDDSQLLIIISNDLLGRTLIDISNYNFDPSMKLFNILCLHKMHLEVFSNSLEVTLDSGVIHAILVVSKDQRILVYRGYLDEADGDTRGMVLVEQIAAKRVTSIKAFITASRRYFIFNGLTPGIYKLDRSGVFKPEFCNYDSNSAVSNVLSGDIEEWLVINTNTYRQDVVILGKSRSKVTAYTWAGSKRGFVYTNPPSCFETTSLGDQNLRYDKVINADLSCLLEEDWSKVGFIEISDSPSFLVTGSSNRLSANLYHLNLSLRPTYGPSDKLDNLHQLTEFNKNDVECLSKEFANEGVLDNLERISSPSNNILPATGTNTYPWSDMDTLETCLSTLEVETGKLSDYLIHIRENSVNVSISVVRGKLTGLAVGKILSEDVSASYSSQAKQGFARSKDSNGEFDFDLRATIRLNKTREYKVKTTVRIGALEIEESPSLAINPVQSNSLTPELAKTEPQFKEEIPLHQSASRDIHEDHRTV